MDRCKFQLLKIFYDGTTLNLAVLQLDSDKVCLLLPLTNFGNYFKSNYFFFSQEIPFCCQNTTTIKVKENYPGSWLYNAFDS